MNFKNSDTDYKAEHELEKDLEKTPSIRRCRRFAAKKIRIIRKYREKMVRGERISEEEIVDALTGISYPESITGNREVQG